MSQRRNWLRFARPSQFGLLGKKQERSRVFLVLFSTRFVSKLPIGYKTKQENFSVLLFLAEREGFEPPVPLSTPVFKTGAIDHSATSPKVFVSHDVVVSF